MHQVWVAIGMAIAVIVVGVPFAAIILVSIASRREEAAHSLSRHAPGAAARAARRLLDYRSEHISPPPDWAAQGRWRQRSSFRPASSPPRLRLVRQAPPIGLAPGAAGQPVPAGKQFREVRFGHARRSLPDSSQYSADGQSQPGSIRADQRQGAGV